VHGGVHETLQPTAYSAEVAERRAPDQNPVRGSGSAPPPRTAKEFSMRSAPALLLAGSVLSFASCSSEPTKPSAPPTPVPAAAAPKGAAPAGGERNGVFAPASSAALSFWPEAYAGELLLVEVMPQGSAVKEGDVVARLETRAIDEQVHQAELEATSA